VDYLHHFQLSEDPFRADAGEKFDVDLPSQGDALARIDRAVRQGKGLVLMVGGVGAGKTRVARHLYEELEEEVFEAAMMVVLRREVGADWLLGRVAQQLGVEEAAGEREALIAQIYERLAIIHEDGRRGVLIIDDAQGIANADALAEVCALVKLEYEDRRLITVVLVGAPTLDAAIAAEPLFAHHVDVRVTLPPLDQEEATAYLAGRIAAAGGNTELLLPGATAALHELSEGAPGRVNILADNALYEGWINERSQVARSDVEQAHRDLGWAGVASGGWGGGEAASGPMPAARPRRPAQAELTDPLGFESPAANGGEAVAVNLDPQLDAVFEHRSGSRPEELGTPESPNTVVMDFDAAPVGAPAAAERPPAPLPPMAEATRIELDMPLDAPPKDDEDEVDDLFMELLDD
jgi:type II secretory pathway predicted ATPase ExeA